MRRQSILAAALLATGGLLGWLAWRVPVVRAVSPELDFVDRELEPAHARGAADVESLASAESPKRLRETRAVAASGDSWAFGSEASILRMRVVELDGRAGVNAQLRIEIHSRDETRPAVVWGNTDGEGRFIEASTIPLDCTELHIDVAFADRWAKQSFEFKAPTPLPQIWDVGDLRLDATLRLTVDVVDVFRTPIDGALITLAGASKHAASTDEFGRAELTIPTSVSDIEIAAPGFYAAVASIPRDAESTASVEVVLDPLCELTIHVAPVPPPATQATVELRYGADSDPRARGRPAVKGAYSAPTLDVPADGRCVWKSMNPGVEMHAEVKSLGVVVAVLDIAALRIGENRLEFITIDMQPCPLDVTVVGPGGEPVMNAFVRLTLNPRERERAFWTDDRGMGRVSLYRPAIVDVKVHAEGYAERELIRNTLSRDSLRIELDRERVVFVSVVDQAGQPNGGVRSVVARARSRAAIAGESIGANVWRLSRLPIGEVVIEADGQGSMIHDTAIPNVTLVAAGSGQVWARFDVAPNDRADRWSLFARSLGNPRYTTRAFDGRMGDTRKLVPMQGLPEDRYEMQIQHLDASRGIWAPWGQSMLVSVGYERVDLEFSP